MTWGTQYHNDETNEYVHVPGIQTFDIGFNELAGANSGQRPDLLLYTARIYRVPDGSLYRSDTQSLVLLPKTLGGGGPGGPYVEPAEMPTLRSRLGAEVWLSDPKWGVYTVFGYTTRDISDVVMAAIDSLPDVGGTVVVANGTVYATDIELSGSAGAKSNVTLQVTNATIRKPAHADLATDAARKSNVVNITRGHGHRVLGKNGCVEGNWHRGGLRPPYSTKAQLGAKDMYGKPERTYKTNAILCFAKDGTGSTGEPDDRIFIVQPAANGKEPSYTNIQEDIDKGWLVEVTHLKWEEVTGTGYMNAWELDTDFAFREGIYFNGLDEQMKGAACVGMEVKDCVYGGILAGAGPLFANSPLLGFGTYGLLVQDCYPHDNQATNIGGGFKKWARILHNTVGTTASTGIRCDEGSDHTIIAHNVIDKGGTGGDKACISAYKSSNILINANSCRNAAVGITTAECDSHNITANEIADCNNGLSCSKMDGGRLIGNQIRNCIKDGFKVSDGHGQVITGNSAEGCGGYGFLIDDTHGGTFGNNTADNNGRDGFYFYKASHTPLLGNTAMNNGRLFPDCAGFRLDGGCNELVGIGNKAFDTRAGVDRTQAWGLLSDGTLAKSNWSNGKLTSNKNGPSNLNGAVGNLLTMNGGESLIEYNGSTILATSESGKATYIMGGKSSPNLAVTVPTNGSPATEYLQITGGTVNGKYGHPTIKATGVSPDVSLVLATTGQGKVRFGTWVPVTGGVGNGVIAVETSDGAVRYLMTQAAPPEQGP